MNTEYIMSLHRGELTSLSQLTDNTFEGIFAKTSALLRLGRFADATQQLSHLDTHEPDFKLEAVLLFADIQQGSGKHTEAFKILEDIHPSHNISPMLCARLAARKGELLQLLQRDEEALVEYTTAFNALNSVGVTGMESSETDAGLPSGSDLLLSVLEGVMNAARNLDFEAETDRAIEKLLEHSENRILNSRLPIVVAQAAEYLNLFGESDDYENHLARALNLAKEKGWKWDEAHVRLIGGRNAEFNGMEDMALDYTMEAWTIFGSIGALPSELAAADQLASVFANLGRGEEAMQTYTSVVNRARQLGDSHMLINSISQVCTLAFELDESQTALDYLVMLMEESTKLAIRPPVLISLMREAWRRLPADEVRAKLGLADEESYGF